MLARNWTSTVRSIAENLLGDMMVQCMVMSISRSQHDYADEIIGGSEAEENAFPWYLVLSLLEGVEAIAKLSLPKVHRLGSPCSSFVVCCSSSRLVTPPLISTISCLTPCKPYIFCEDMILAMCHRYRLSS